MSGIVGLWVVLAVTLGAHLATGALAALRYLPRRSGPQSAPPSQLISLIRPVCGCDRFDRETLGSSFTLGWRDYEVLFCATSEHDPAVPLVRELIAAHPGVNARLLIGEDSISSNPKLNNLVKGLQAARGKWVVMTDSNLLLPRDYLERLVERLQGDTGLVSAPPVGIRPENFWGAVECAFLNTNQARWQLAADSLGIGFAQGKTLFWNRDVLRAGGGMAALGRNIAEDVAATHLVRAQGLKVRLAGRLFAQPIGARPARAVWGRQLRWSRVRRDGFPALFMAEILQGPIIPALALAGLAGLGAAPGWSLGVLALVWYGSELALARLAGWPAALRDLAAMVVRDVMLPALWVATFAQRGITWRGTEMAAPTRPDPAK